MTDQAGPTGAARDEEIAEYLEAVRAATRDLPVGQREELLDDLATHLAEVAADSPAPLRHRLGPPEQYAAELRAAASEDSGSAGVWLSRRQRLAARWQQWRERLSVLDQRLGPWLGYERATEYTRLLVPAWWLLRGYLAAMLVVHILDHRGQVGLLPRLGGSTLAGLVILAGFMIGSVWLAHRTPHWSRWPRRVVLIGSMVVVLYGLIGFLGLDDRQRYGPPIVYQEVVQHHQQPSMHHPPPSTYHPHPDVTDVYVVDERGRLLTDVFLLDQHGRPIDLGRCGDDFQADDSRGGDFGHEEPERLGPDGEPMISYPRCPDRLPWWLSVQQPSPTPVDPSPEPTGDPVPVPTVGTSPTAEPGPAPRATPEVTVTPTARPG